MKFYKLENVNTGQTTLINIKYIIRLVAKNDDNCWIKLQGDDSTIKVAQNIDVVANEIFACHDQ